MATWRTEHREHFSKAEYDAYYEAHIKSLDPYEEEEKTPEEVCADQVEKNQTCTPNCPFYYDEVADYCNLVRAELYGEEIK